MEATGLADTAIELRYLGLVRLSGGIAGASTWGALATATADALETMGSPAPVRLWCTTPDGFAELARVPAHADLKSISQRELRAAAERASPAPSSDGRLLLGLHASGVSMGVLEVAGAVEHTGFLSDAAPIIASAIGLLAAQGVGDAVLEPLAVDAASDATSVMAAFAEQAGRLLAHDRLSAYLLTPNGQAFERFAVATSPIIPGEGVVIPFEDVGLRHIVITNRALVSEDLSADPRIVGREDRVIARAGFRGLLSAPLRREGRPIGVLNFVSKTPGFYRDEDIPIAQQMADQVSVFLENLRRQRRMRALVRQEATERERARVSRDLLDTVIHSAPTIGAIAAELRERLAPLDAQAAAEVDRIIDLSRQELADIRRAVLGMSPRAFDNRSLEDVVESTLVQFRDATGIKTTWTVTGDTGRLPATVEQASYRILQEALANVRIHSGADSLRVELTVSDSLTLTIEDDGVGFDAEEASRAPSLGLQGMTERASALGGAFTIATAPGEGTRVELEVPAVGDAGHGLPAADGDLEEPAQAGSGTLRVFVAERNSLIRAGLIRVLERTGSIRVVGEASSADEVRGQVGRLCPDVVLLDEQLEADHSLKLTRELASSSPNSAILITARSMVAAAADLLGAGGTGVVHKSIEPDELVNAVRAVAGGSRLIAGSGGGVEDDPEGGGLHLSKRQREILALVAAGQTNAEIAEALFFATKTVERHVGTIFGKLGARNRAHAAALAVSQQLVELDES
jgi:signal transduction histidine kinase/DNA-binding NarL/FixJ family response regulator